MLTRNAKTSMNSTRKDANTKKDTNASSTEFVSLATLREMLQMQERMFKNMFESVLSSVNTRIDKVVKSVAELKASLEYSQQDIDDLKEAADTRDDQWKKNLMTSKQGYINKRKNWYTLRTKAVETMSASMEFPNNTTKPG